MAAHKDPANSSVCVDKLVGEVKALLFEINPKREFVNPTYVGIERVVTAYLPTAVVKEPPRLMAVNTLRLEDSLI